MTTQFRLVHEFPKVSISRFEKYLNHPKLIKMLAQMPGYETRELLEQGSAPDGGTIWKFQVRAMTEIPPALRKVVPQDLFSWVETSHFVPKEHCIYWTITPNKNIGKFQGQGRWVLQKNKEGTTRIIEGEISVAIPLVGKMIESFIVNELKKSYEVEPDIQRKFFDEMPE